MRCQACGSMMEETYRSHERDRTYVWYACRSVACRQELLHVKGDAGPVLAEEKDLPVGGQV